jgi:hypothetical protein
VSLFFAAAGLMFAVDEDCLCGLDWRLLVVPFVCAVLALVTVAVGRRTPRDVMMGGVVIWLALGAFNFFANGFTVSGLVFQTFGLPGIAATLFVAADTEVRDLWPALRQTPLFLPITVVVLLTPSLTADIWRVAQELTPGRIASFGVLILAPLLIVITFRTRRPVAAVETALARELELPPEDRRARAADHAASFRTPLPVAVGSAPAWIRTGAAWEVISAAVADAKLGRAAENTKRDPLALRSVRRRVRVSVLALVSAVFVAATAAVYMTTTLLVPVEVAEEWGGAVDEFGGRVEIPRLWVAHQPRYASNHDGLGLYGGPYVALAVLFGLIAVAVLLTGMTVRRGPAATST